MNRLAQLLASYKAVHLNPKNVKLHFVGIPLIIFSIVAFLRVFLDPLSESLGLPSVTGLALVTMSVIFYYLWLDWRFSIGMMVFFCLVGGLNLYFIPLDSALVLGAVIFVVGWIIQFVGHYYEKARPAFFDDILLLLIGPLFLVAEVCFAYGLRSELEEEVTNLAIEKRKQIA